MLDIQSEKDTRNVPLDKVGVKGVSYPVRVLDKKNTSQMTTGTVDLFVNLPKNFKGTHMSRFIETLHKYHKDLTMQHFISMLQEIRAKLNAQKAYGKVSFPYYIEKEAPVTHSPSYLCYNCSYEAEVGKENLFYVNVAVPVTSLCPCSRSISDKGAHNQRAIIRVHLLYKHFFWLEDLISKIESISSSPLYTALKRRDEKFVTEKAFENPRFVEDLVREVYLLLLKMKFTYFTVEAESFESIHLHNAYARAEYRGE